MKNPNSPFRIWIRTSFYGLLMSVALSCWLFGTSKNSAQMLLALVVFVLSALLSLVVGFYVALRAYFKREALRDAQSRFAVHYPARAKIDSYLRTHHG